jgi:hypothetical protein
MLEASVVLGLSLGVGVFLGMVLYAFWQVGQDPPQDGWGDNEGDNTP